MSTSLLVAGTPSRAPEFGGWIEVKPLVRSPAIARRDTAFELDDDSNYPRIRLVPFEGDVEDW